MKSKFSSVHFGKTQKGNKYMKICLGNWRLVIANCPVALKNQRTLLGGRLRRKIKEHKLEERQCKCEICGKELTDFRRAELHHIIPVSLVPEMARDPKNMMILCRDCHKAIHSNPFVYSRQILDYYPEVAAQFSLQ